MTSATSGDLRQVRVATATTRNGAIAIVEIDIAVSSDGTSRISVDSEDGVVAVHRVHSALNTSNLPFPSGRVAVTVSEPVAGFDPAFDLALALGLLVVQGMVPADAISDIIAVGELALDGRVRPCRGVFPVVVAATCRTPRPIVLVPAANREEAALVDQTHFVAVAHLSEVVPLLAGTVYTPGTDPLDVQQIEGMTAAKQALAISAAGRHHLLVMGPPGTGKTMLAKRLPGLLPPLSRVEALEVTALYSIAGLLPSGASYISTRPFRAPHYTVSEAAMLGGGRRGFRPGEVSLAHRGVLFLDEVTEFDRRLLLGVNLLLSGVVDLGPSGSPDVLCVAAMMPCPCGWHGHATPICGCTVEQIRRHRQRAAPLLEHFDLQIDLSPARQGTGHDPSAWESSQAIRPRVVAARERQRREGRLEAFRGKGRADATSLLSACSPEALRALDESQGAMESLPVLRIARTIADLQDRDQVEVDHLIEARTLTATWR